MTLKLISNSSSFDIHALTFSISEDECTVQSGESGSCVVYSQCRPLLEMISNLRQPLPPQVPSLLQGSILCGFEKIKERSLPKVCCPKGAVNTLVKER